MQEWKWNNDAPELDLAAPQIPSASSNFGFNGTKYPGGWGIDQDTFAESLLNLDYFTLRARSTQLFETNLYARGIIRRLITNEVNTGLDLESRPIALMLPNETEAGLHAWSDRVEAYWGAYIGDSRVCDFEKRPEMTFGELTAAARREALVGGDVLIVLRTGETGLPNVQLFGGHLVIQPLRADDLPEGHTVQHGVELNASGQQVAYYVQQQHTNQFGVSLETMRIAANAPDGSRLAWLMYGTDKRVGQVRGVPLLGLVLQSLKEIDKYRDSAQRKAIINSILSMWIEKGEDKLGSLPATGGAVRTGEVVSTNFDGGQRQWNLADQIPGLVWEELQHGEKPHAFKSDGGEQNYPEFEAALISAIFWACEIPPEIGALSFNANYSASQAALNEFKIYLGVMRERIAKAFNQRIYTEWLRAAILRGTISATGLIESATDISQFETLHAWTNAAWIGAVKPVTDILKMVKAFEIMVEKGWTTNARVAREMTGTKFQTNARVLLREREELPIQVPPAPAVAPATASDNEGLTP